MRSEEQLLGTLADLSDRVRTEAGSAPASADVVAARPGARHSRLLDAVRALDKAASLSEILDTLTRSASREAAHAGVLLVRDGGLREWRPDDTTPRSTSDADEQTIADAIASGQTVQGGPTFIAIPLLVAGQVVAILCATREQGTHVDSADEADWAIALEILGRHSARCLEAVTAFKTARFVSKAAGSPSRAGDDEQAARRYARLLISEIRLYHEAAIVQGRRHRDLMSRLGGEIARAQALYEQRVPDEIRRGTDYFHAELVRTLANGDPSLFGPWQSGPARG